MCVCDILYNTRVYEYVSYDITCVLVYDIIYHMRIRPYFIYDLMYEKTFLKGALTSFLHPHHYKLQMELL